MTATLAAHVAAVPQALLELARTEATGRVFALLDGARDSSIHAELVASPNSRGCLYAGNLAPRLEAAAPWLTELGRADDGLTRWLIDRGWGKSWGVFLCSTAGLDELRAHFRRFLMVKTEERKTLYFRFYDPRVLRVYLPTCTRDELETVFGPVRAFLVEGRSPGVILRFERAPDGTLSTTTTEVAAAPAAGAAPAAVAPPPTPVPAAFDEADAVPVDLAELLASLKALREGLRAHDDDETDAPAREALVELKALQARVERAPVLAREGELEPLRTGLRQVIVQCELRKALTAKVVGTRLAAMLVRLRVH